ncbi:hypothetical protein NXV10_01910 [Bacteroides thetaiotaomicron]|nr:hypothetical protein [Bacteroides thetaiotaomicron]
MKEVEKMNIVFNHFNSRNNKDSEYYFTKLLSFPYKEDEGWGFSNVEQNDNFLEVTLLKRLPTYFSSWNDGLNIMEKKTIQIVKEVKFYLDFGRGLLSCEGGITNLNYVKQALRLSFWKEFVYEDLKMLPYDYLIFLMQDEYLSEIKEITINDFNYNDIVIGNILNHKELGNNFQY